MKHEKYSMAMKGNEKVKHHKSEYQDANKLIPKVVKSDGQHKMPKLDINGRSMGPKLNPHTDTGYNASAVRKAVRSVDNQAPEPTYHVNGIPEKEGRARAAMRECEAQDQHLHRQSR